MIEFAEQAPGDRESVGGTANDRGAVDVPAYRHVLRIAFFLLFASGISSRAPACDVPVFRYALERWPVDPYRAVAVEVTPFTQAEKKALAKLRGRVGAEGLNLRLQVMKQETFLKSANASLVTAPVTANTLFLFYPANAGPQRPVWRGGISLETLDKLSDCHTRDQLTRLLLDGSSAVFLLLESGDPKKDKEVRLLLEASCKELNRQIKLPSGVIAADEKEETEDPVNRLQSPIPFRINFAVLTIPEPLPKKDSAEILRHCLLGLEPDLRELQEKPMVFLVYGRGRVLQPLIGKGINAGMIDQLAAFVTGACSCQVKAQNPGTDLLIGQDWDKAVLKEEVE